MIAQFDLFTGEPEPIKAGQSERRLLVTKNAIETERYRYKLAKGKLTVTEKRNKQRHEHALRGLINNDNPMQTFVFRMEKLEKTQNKRFYCLGAFLLEFMNRDQLLKECQAIRENP